MRTLSTRASAQGQRLEVGFDPSHRLPPEVVKTVVAGGRHALLVPLQLEATGGAAVGLLMSFGREDECAKLDRLLSTLFRGERTTRRAARAAAAAPQSSSAGCTPATRSRPQRSSGPQRSRSPSPAESFVRNDLEHAWGGLRRRTGLDF